MKKTYVFTQQLVWESLGYDPGTFLNNSVQAEYTNWRANVLNEIETMDKLVSFNGNEVTLNIGEKYTLTDTNERLQKYPTVDTILNGIRFEHTNGSNELKITATNECTSERYIFDSRDIGLRLQYGGNIQYVYLFSDGSQKNIYTNGYGTDPTFYLELKINLTGRLELTKTNTNGELIDGAVFRIWSDDTEYDKTHTVVDGKIVVDNLKPGTYYIKETSNTGYLLDVKTYSVNVKANETAKQTVINDEPTGTITVEKKNANGDKLGEGFVFKITADEDIYNVARTVKHYSKGETVATITTSSAGIATKSGLPLRSLFSS